jgi:hypothetical protein
MDMGASSTAERELGLEFSSWATTRGILTATVVSWLLSVQLLYGSQEIFDALRGTPFEPRELIMWTYGPTLGFLAIFGLPLSLIVTCLFGLPFWMDSVKHHHTGFSAAAKVGVITAAIVIGFELMAALMFASRRAEFAPWLIAKFLADIICTIGIGALTGLAARLAAGPPRRRPA